MRAQLQGALDQLDSDRADRAERLGAPGAPSCLSLSVITQPPETPNALLCAADRLARLPRVDRLRLEVAGVTAQRQVEAFNATVGKALLEPIETTVRRNLAGKMKGRAGFVALLCEGVADLRAFFPRGEASVGAALAKPTVDEAAAWGARRRDSRAARAG